MTCKAKELCVLQRLCYCTAFMRGYSPVQRTGQQRPSRSSLDWSTICPNPFRYLIRSRISKSQTNSNGPSCSPRHVVFVKVDRANFLPSVRNPMSFCRKLPFHGFGNCCVVKGASNDKIPFLRCSRRECGLIVRKSTIANINESLQLVRQNGCGKCGEGGIAYRRKRRRHSICSYESPNKFQALTIDFVTRRRLVCGA